MPSASRRAVSALTPSDRRNASTVRWRSREFFASLLAYLGQKYRTVRLLRNKPLFCEALQHLGDSGLCNSQPLCNIDLPRLPLR